MNSSVEMAIPNIDPIEEDIRILEKEIDDLKYWINHSQIPRYDKKIFRKRLRFKEK